MSGLFLCIVGLCVVVNGYSVMKTLHIKKIGIGEIRPLISEFSQIELRFTWFSHSNKAVRKRTG